MSSKKSEADKQQTAKSSGEKDNNDVNMQTIPNVRPLKYGSACPPMITSSDVAFRGRGGVWICENCSCKIVLEPQTKQWTCPQCERTMYTVPNKDQCPLDTFCPCCCWDAILTRN
mmetsp:Transcript_21061/g.33906  ORF Transcript_21061/g.33906 Transcript_21061/m.33906 type:complete len:115 (-) Transcript_21061:1646-1990(-)